MLDNPAKCQECGQLIASQCTHHPQCDQMLTHGNDNSQEKAEVTVEKLSKMSGLDEDALMHRLAKMLCRRNDDLINTMDATRPAE